MSSKPPQSLDMEIRFMNDATFKDYKDRDVESLYGMLAEGIVGAGNPYDTPTLRKHYYENVWPSAYEEMLKLDPRYSEPSETKLLYSCLVNKFVMWMGEMGILSPNAQRIQENWNNGKYIIETLAVYADIATLGDICVFSSFLKNLVKEQGMKAALKIVVTGTVRAAADTITSIATSPVKMFNKVKSVLKIGEELRITTVEGLEFTMTKSELKAELMKAGMADDVAEAAVRQLENNGLAEQMAAGREAIEAASPNLTSSQLFDLGTSCADAVGCAYRNGIIDSGMLAQIGNCTGKEIEVLFSRGITNSQRVAEIGKYTGETIGEAIRRGVTNPEELSRIGSAARATVQQTTKLGVTDSAIISSKIAKAVNMSEKIYKNFTVDEINALKKYVIDECQVIKNTGLLRNDDLGPAIAGVYNKRTGKFYTAINDYDGKIPSDLVQSLKDRIDNMPQEVLDSYARTKRAGSHAEVYAVNKALLDDSSATVDDFNIPGGMTKPVVEDPFHTCPHCEYILDGFKILSDIF